MQSKRKSDFGKHGRMVGLKMITWRRRGIPKRKCTWRRKLKINALLDVTRNKEHINQLFRIARQIVKTNCDVTGDKCVINDDGELECTDNEKLSAWK